MLHAARVGFDEIAAQSPDADDFAALCARLRAGNRKQPDF